MTYMEQLGRGPEELPEEALLTSAEFCMYSYKILPCRKRYGHVWSECVFAHVGEKVARRCPRQSTYTALMCPDLKKGGECPRGEACCFAHNSFEYWLHPTRYKTEFCAHGARCTRRVCFFAHSEAELRPSSNDLRARLPQMMAAYMNSMPAVSSPVPEPMATPAWYTPDPMADSQVQSWPNVDPSMRMAHLSSNTASPRPWMANYKPPMAASRVCGTYAALAPNTRQFAGNWPASTMAPATGLPYYYQGASQPQFQPTAPATSCPPASKPFLLEPSTHLASEYTMSKALPVSQAMVYSAPRVINTMPVAAASVAAEQQQQQSPLHSDHSGSEDMPLGFPVQYDGISEYQEYCLTNDARQLMMGLDSQQYTTGLPSSRIALGISMPMPA